MSGDDSGSTPGPAAHATQQSQADDSSQPAGTAHSVTPGTHANLQAAFDSLSLNTPEWQRRPPAASSTAVASSIAGEIRVGAAASDVGAAVSAPSHSPSGAAASGAATPVTTHTEAGRDAERTGTTAAANEPPAAGANHQWPAVVPPADVTPAAGLPSTSSPHAAAAAAPQQTAASPAAVPSRQPGGVMSDEPAAVTFAAEAAESPAPAAATSSNSAAAAGATAHRTPEPATPPQHSAPSISLVIPAAAVTVADATPSAPEAGGRIKVKRVCGCRETSDHTAHLSGPVSHLLALLTAAWPLTRFQRPCKARVT